MDIAFYTVSVRRGEAVAYDARGTRVELVDLPFDQPVGPVWPDAQRIDIQEGIPWNRAPYDGWALHQVTP